MRVKDVLGLFILLRVVARVGNIRHITGDYEGFINNHKIKIKTGAYGILEHDGMVWNIERWGMRP